MLVDGERADDVEQMTRAVAPGRPSRPSRDRKITWIALNCRQRP